MPKKVFVALAALTFFLTLFFIDFIPNVEAASLTTLSNVLTRLQKGELSSHTIQFTLPITERFDENEYLEYDFGNDKGKWTISKDISSIGDFSFYDGSKRTIAGINGDCAGHFGLNDVVIKIQEGAGLLRIVSCKNFTSSPPEAKIIFKVGSTAGGKNIIKNPAEAGSAIIKITHLNQTSKTIFGQLAVPIMEFDGVGSTWAENDSNPNLLGSQTGKITLEKTSADSLTIIQKSKETSLTPKVNLAVEDCLFTNFTSTIPNF